MTKYYTDERNAQVILALLKKHGIKKVIASPGTTNMALVTSMQYDGGFEMYSSADERSASYLACGLASETGEAVVISCTGATASRNYLPGLTEAFYRKLPILAITSTPMISKVGHHFAQVIDRSSLPNDVAKLSITLPIVKDENDLWDCEIKVNQAILELKRYGGGPVHLNLPTTYSTTYATKELPKVRIIDRISSTDVLPKLPQGKIAVLIGAHAAMSKEQTNTIDMFCASNNAVVFCDHTSGYKGKYRVLFSLVAGQKMLNLGKVRPDLLIHIGEISGDYYSMGIAGKQVWRISEDGEIRDAFQKLRYVFEMSEIYFFNHYIKKGNDTADNYLNICKNQLDEIYKKMPELPFSNIWLASKMAHRIPTDSTVHFGILNSLRSWNFFEIPSSVTSNSNVGGFGIDGVVSSLVGASFSNQHKLYFAVVGDLAFFYDINVLGNRHLGPNVRILLVNNGKGTEFKQFTHVASEFRESADNFVAAAGHYGNKSTKLVKNYAQSLNFEYLSAQNKTEFENVYERFLTNDITDKPMLLEVFTNDTEESEALKAIMSIKENLKGAIEQKSRVILGKKGVAMLRKAFNK